MPNTKLCCKLIAAIAGLAMTAGSLMAQIAVVNSASVVSPVADDPKTAVLSFNAGAAATKLIVQVSAEGQNVASIAYQGVALSEAVAGVGRNKGIFYLDNPFTGGAADLSITLGEGTSVGIAVGMVSISGAAPGAAVSALANDAASVTLTVPVSGGFVVAGYAANGSGTITPPAGHTALYNSTNIGSAHAAASYVNAQSSGSRTYTFGDTNVSFPVTSAAVFVPANAAPAITATSPASGASAVPPDANLVATFSEPVVAGSSGSIELWQSGGSSPIESFDVATSSQLTFDGPTLTIDPVDNLAPGTFYYILIGSTAVIDTSGGNPFAGITNPAVWTFSTGSSPPLSPTFSPKDDAFGVALTANLVATFSETIQKSTGNITIHRADGSVFETIAVTSAAVTVSGGTVTINPANNFAAGVGYYVLIDSTALRNTAGQFYAGISDPTLWNFTSLPELTTVDGRLEWSLQQGISSPWPATTTAPGMASFALAAMRLGIEVEAANDFINQFHSQFPVPDSDTIDFNSYFWLHLMWRIYHDPAMNARLTPQARANIEDMMWRWIRTRSRLTDAQGTEWVYHGSENHDAMQKSGYLLCAEALKDAPGYGPNLVLADGGTIAQHAAAWSDYFPRYFAGRAREGINAEIASPIYAKYTVGVYYNLMDFAESPILRTLAQRFITLYWADTASDWTRSGVRGGAETRCYKDNYLRLGSQYSFEEILWSYGWHANAGAVRTYGLLPAASSYRVPEIITSCAADPARPNYLYTSRRWGRTSGSVGEDNFVTFDNGNSNLRRDTWVTPDYTMGTLTFDMNRDYLQIIDQNRAMGVMFASGVNDRIMVFGKGAASNDKSYADLSGVTRANCMIVQRDFNANNSGSGTLVFVPQALWDARIETSGWLFLQSGNAYCALRPAGGTYTATSAAYGVDLSLSNIWAPVIIQLGQATNYTDFAAFQTSVIANALTFSSNVLNYTSEAGDTFTFYANSKTTPRVNGATVDLNPAKTYDSPYLSMDHEEYLATVSYPGYQDLLLNFDPSSTGFIGVTASTQRFQSTNSPTHTLANFTVAPGNHRKLVLTASWENNNGDISATWNGSENFSLAVKRGGGRNSAILYLDNPTPGTGNVVVTFGSSVTSRIGVASLVGAAGGIAATSSSGGRSGSLTTPLDNSMVIGVYTSNEVPTISGPFSTTLHNGNSGSCAGNAGYQTMLSAGPGHYAWTASAPAADNNVLAAIVPASAAPVILATSPADDALDVPVSANLVATFSEPVAAGNGFITIKRTADNGTVESFNVTSSTRLGFSGQTLTIDPTFNLPPGAGHYVLIDSGAVIDTSGGDAFTGISDTTRWSFTTATGDDPPPVIASLLPADDAANVPLGGNLLVTFSEPVTAGIGAITLRRTDDNSTVESFNLPSSSRLTFSGASLTIDPTNDLERATGYYVTMDATVVVDSSGSTFPGLAGNAAWNFTTEGIRVAASASNGITVQTGFTNTIPGFTVAAGSKLVLAASWENGNSGISATWNGSEAFTVTVNSADGRNSAILYLDNPTPGTGDIVVNFPVATGSRVGVLSLVGAAKGVTRTSFATGVSGSLDVPVDESLVVGVYTCNDLPTITGPFSSTLYNGGSGSSAGNSGYRTEPAAGLANYAWTVTAPASDNNALAAFAPASAAPVIVTTAPADDAIDVPETTNLVATFSEPVVAGTGFITIKKTADNSTVESFNVASSPRLTFSGQTLTIDPTTSLASGAAHYVLIDSGAIIDTSGGNAFAGISDTATWSFTTEAGDTFAEWISNPAYGLAVADQGLAADPDGDGIDNGVENFFGTHPKEFSQGLVVVTADPGSGTLTFTHPQNATPVSDMSAIYTWSKDLASFFADGAIDGALTKVDFTTQLNTPTPGITTVTATVTGTAAQKLFVRVDVTRN